MSTARNHITWAVDLLIGWVTSTAGALVSQIKLTALAAALTLATCLAATDTATAVTLHQFVGPGLPGHMGINSL